MKIFEKSKIGKKIESFFESFGVGIKWKFFESFEVGKKMSFFGKVRGWQKNESFFKSFGVGNEWNRQKMESF
jgi:hypothetical protein